MSPLALRQRIGQLLIAGFGGEQIPSELRSLAREFSLGGVILFARNVVDPEQVAEVSFEAARIVTDVPAWVSIDQEGGRVARLKAPFTEWPPMATLGRAGDEKLAYRFASAPAFRQLQRVYRLARLHVNFFQPVEKLVSKTRQGARAYRVYDRAQPPYQRLCAARILTAEQHQALEALYQSLNPLQLQRDIEAALERLWRLAAPDPSRASVTLTNESTETGG